MTNRPSELMPARIGEIENWHWNIQREAKVLNDLLKNSISRMRKGEILSEDQQATIADARKALLTTVQNMPAFNPEPLLNGGRAFSCDSLAERWKVSGSVIRTLCKSGKLPSWRLGDKLIRIHAATVAAVERGEISLE